MNNLYDLSCRFDTRNSFYGKATVKVFDLNGVKLYELYSYGTNVAYIKEYENTKKFVCLGKYSQTTTRHQKEFFKQNGLNDKEIKELFKKEVLIKENNY